MLGGEEQLAVDAGNTVAFEKLQLQLPTTRDRIHFARCPALVHQFLDGTLGVCFQGTLAARYDRAGVLLRKGAKAYQAA